MAMKSCPYCAEDIRAAAVRCPHCRSRLRTFVVEGWHRDQPGRMVAGVSAALAAALGMPVVFVRAAFVVLCFVHLFGVFAYGLLWVMIPGRPGEPSVLEAWLERAQAFARRLSGRGGHGEAPPPASSGASSDSGRIALNESRGER